MNYKVMSSVRSIKEKKSIYISVHRKQGKEIANSLTFCELVMTLTFEKRRPTHPN